MSTAWVTGSSSGIGLAIARYLLERGWQVTGLDRAAPVLNHASFHPVMLDLSDAGDTEQALQIILARGTPFALVHCAGLLRVGNVGELDHEAGTQMWQLHVDAAARLANHVLPAMRQLGRGRMVLIGSRISSGLAGRSQYAASKAALSSLARSWGAEFVTAGITVNVVSPGATDTPMLQDPQRAGSTPRLPPIGRLIRPEEVAALAGFLLSPEAAALTGQDIAVCGGASLPR